MLQLSLVTEGAAKGEVSRPGTGAACGTSQLPSPSFRLNTPDWIKPNA